MNTLQDNLNFLEKHLVEALNAALEGTCKAKGIARLECALVTLMEIRDQLGEQYERPVE